MYYTDRNKKNIWEDIELGYKNAINKFLTFNGMPIEQNAALYSINYRPNNFYEVITKPSKKEPTNIYYNIKDANKYYYSQPPTFPQFVNLGLPNLKKK